MMQCGFTPKPRCRVRIGGHITLVDGRPRPSGSHEIPRRLVLFVRRWLWDCPGLKHTCTGRDKEYSLDETASGMAAYDGDGIKRKGIEAYCGLAFGVMILPITST